MTKTVSCNLNLKELYYYCHFHIQTLMNTLDMWSVPMDCIPPEVPRNINTQARADTDL